MDCVGWNSGKQCERRHKHIKLTTVCFAGTDHYGSSCRLRKNNSVRLCCAITVPASRYASGVVFFCVNYNNNIVGINVVKIMHLTYLFQLSGMNKLKLLLLLLLLSLSLSLSLFLSTGRKMSESNQNIMKTFAKIAVAVGSYWAVSISMVRHSELL